MSTRVYLSVRHLITGLDTDHEQRTCQECGYTDDGAEVGIFGDGVAVHTVMCRGQHQRIGPLLRALAALKS